VVLKVYSGPKRRSARVLLLLLAILSAYAAFGSDSSPSLDSSLADQWEVAIAKDGYHHIYFLYSQREMPCLGCASQPRLLLAAGNDQESPWEAPRQLTPPSFDQVNPSLAVDANDQRTVYAVWLERQRQDVLLAKSSDFGRSWSLFVVARALGAAARPVIAVRGENVSIAFSRNQQMWAASSHDGGITFEVASLKTLSSAVDVFPGGTTIDPNGNAYVAWEGYSEVTTAKQTGTSLYVSKSADEGKTWTTTLMDVSSGAPNCKVSACEWGYLGAQITIASDAAGTLYALWNSSLPGKQDAERIFFSSSTTAGETWSPKSDVSGAPPGTRHVLPAIMAGNAGEVRVAWMDARNSPRWSAYSRNSTNGGATWSTEELLSMYVPSSGYIPFDNFDLPFVASPEDARQGNDSGSNTGGL
jgi:hypothetical protein